MIVKKIKSFFNDFFCITIIVAIFSMAIIKDSFAIADYPDVNSNYNVMYKNGENIFHNYMDNILPWPYITEIGGMSRFAATGDMTIELDNPMCLIEVVLAVVEFKVAAKIASNYEFPKNMAVYLGALGVLLVLLMPIYAIAASHFYRYEICGANWLNWGHSGIIDDQSEPAKGSALNDIHKYYPSKGAWGGSVKYYVNKCFQDVEQCMAACEGGQQICAQRRAQEIAKAEQRLKEKIDFGLVQGPIEVARTIDNDYKRYIAQTESDYTDCLNNNICILDVAFMKADGNRKYLNMHDRVYREKIYDGQEVINDHCLDPREEAKHYDIFKDSDSKKIYQTYYMRGYDKGNYACERYLANTTSAYKDAYNCCVNASKSVCIAFYSGVNISQSGQQEIQEEGIYDNLNKITGKDAIYEFCEINDYHCDLHGIVFGIYKGDDGTPDKYCVKTRSLCPYNYNLERGTEKAIGFDLKESVEIVTEPEDPKCKGSDCKMITYNKLTVTDECFSKADDKPLSCKNQVKNFYQLNRHCTIVEEYKSPYQIVEENYPPYIDKSCINFVGSSHNFEEYQPYSGYNRILSKNNNLFTAPIAECITETLKNFLLNRAGHTKCLTNEIPTDEEICETGYKYKIYDNLADATGLESTTSRLLRHIHSILMLVFMLFIVIYGYNILLTGKGLKREEWVLALFKLVVVVTFSYNTWWYDQVYKFMYGFSQTFSMLTAKIGFDDAQDEYGNYLKFDGCYFGDITNILDKKPTDEIPSIINNYDKYPATRRYVAFFDTLDCKISKYLSVSGGTDGITSNLMIAIASAILWPVHINLYIAIGTLMILFFVIMFAAEAVYIFVASSIALTVLLLLSPMMIPCILFEKTKKMFEGWLKNLISFALQPMIMFAYISIALTIIDTYTLGHGIMIGQGIHKSLICGYSCETSSGKILDYTGDKDGKDRMIEKCQDNTLYDLKHSSFLCLLSNLTSSTGNALLSFGLTIPALIDIFSSDLTMILRIAFLFFILVRTLAGVAGVAANLTGGKALPRTERTSPFNMARSLLKYGKTASNVNKQLAQWGYGKASKMVNWFKDGVRSRGNYGKEDSTDDKNKESKKRRK